VSGSAPHLNGGSVSGAEISRGEVDREGALATGSSMPMPGSALHNIVPCPKRWQEDNMTPPTAMEPHVSIGSRANTTQQPKGACSFWEVVSPEMSADGTSVLRGRSLALTSLRQVGPMAC